MTKHTPDQWKAALSYATALHKADPSLPICQIKSTVKWLAPCELYEGVDRLRRDKEGGLRYFKALDKLREDLYRSVRGRGL